MAVIAIIDDAINPQFPIFYKVKQVIRIQNGHFINNPRFTESSYTHATICAMLLDKFTNNYEIINIQILKDMTTQTGIKNLQCALELCLSLKVDIISMSIGTIFLSNSIWLNDIIMKLYSKGVIMVAALSNQPFITLPASYSQVIGVKQDREKLLKPGQFYYTSNDKFNIKMICNCMLEMPMEEYYPCNSFAVPIIVAKINDYYNKGIQDYQEILKWLKKDSSKVDNQESCLDIDEFRNQLPIIGIIGQKDQVGDACVALMNALYKNFKYESVGISSDFKVQDIRMFHVSSMKKDKLFNKLMFIENHTTTDLIYIPFSINESDDIEHLVAFDLLIHIENNSIIFLFPDNDLEIIKNKEVCNPSIDLGEKNWAIKVSEQIVSFMT